jgi:hypothetical protein
VTLRIILSVVVVTLWSAIAAVGGIDARSAEPANDFVFAAFDDDQGSGLHFFINAWSGPAGEHPQGRMLTNWPQTRGPIHVDCLAVRGHEAYLIADIPSQFWVIALLVRDKHPGPDEVIFIDERQGSSPHVCPGFGDIPHGLPGRPVSGFIRVHDAREP